MKPWQEVGTTLEMIKWEHSVFALPFALTGAVLAASGVPRLGQVFWIAVCMVAARSAGMAFNVGASALFVFGAAELNRLTLLLAPAVLAVLLGYSYTKRFTRWSHMFLGLALGIAPAGAWVAVRGSLDPRILVLTLLVLCWVGGFDVLYACQDAEHDRRVGLKSLPASLGVGGAFWVARGLHLLMLALSVWLVHLFGLGALAWAGLAVVAALLLYEHSIVSPGDLSRMDAAFFTMNGFVSVAFFVFVAGAVLVKEFKPH